MALLIEHGLTSPPTPCKLYGRRFLQVTRPNQLMIQTLRARCEKVQFSVMIRLITAVHFTSDLSTNSTQTVTVLVI